VLSPYDYHDVLFDFAGVLTRTIAEYAADRERVFAKVLAQRAADARAPTSI
jgi:hypothetical protein